MWIADIKRYSSKLSLYNQHTHAAPPSLSLPVLPFVLLVVLLHPSPSVSFSFSLLPLEHSHVSMHTNDVFGQKTKKPHTFIFSLRFFWSSVCLSAVLAAVYLSTCLFIFTFPPSHHFILTFVPPLFSHPLVFLSSKFLLSTHFLSSLSFFFFFPHLFCLPSSLSLSLISCPLSSVSRSSPAANPLGCGAAFLPGFSGSGFVRETPVSPPPPAPPPPF